MPTSPIGQIRSFRDLLAWQKAMDLAVQAYRLSHQLPAEERYALANQIRRSASSIPANIAEGAGRRNTGEYLQGLSVALGSLRELETHLTLASRLGFTALEASEAALATADEVARMLHGLMRSLRAKRRAGRRTAPDAS